jgi:predicted dehydrogenase
VGCGYWGAKHIRVLNGFSDTVSVSAVDQSAENLNAVGSAFQLAGAYKTLDEAFPHIDAVVIATPPLSHAKLASAALSQGKHVLVEKPLTRSLEESRALVDLADRSGCTLMVGHTFEFNPAVRELRRRLDRNELGEVLYIHSSRLNLGLYRSDVNVVWDLAPHDISIMNYLLQSKPTTVAAWGSSHAQGSIEDLAYIRLDYEDVGVIGYAHMSWLDPKKVRQVTVVGRDKMATYDDLSEERLRIFNRGVDPEENEMAKFERPVSYRNGDIISPHISMEEPLALEDRHFIDCILSGEKPLTDGRSGLNVVAVLDAIDRSLVTGGICAVNYAVSQLKPPRMLNRVSNLEAVNA